MMYQKELPILLNAGLVTEILNVHPRTVARLCESGKLKAVKVGTQWRINRDALLEFAGLSKSTLITSMKVS